MPRWLLITLLTIAVIAAGIGTTLITRGTLFGAPAYGWTAYAPLVTAGSARYTPFDPTWLTWAPRLGATLLALGAGTTGATTTALTLQHRHRRRNPTTNGR